MTIEHLGPEAVAALVDGELTPRAAARARQHLSECPQCREEVGNQYAVAQHMRDGLAVAPGNAQCPSAPVDLRAKLASIPERMMPQAQEPVEREHDASAGKDVHGVASGKMGKGASPLPSKYFGIDGRRFPRTLADHVGLVLQKIRTLRRPRVR